MFANPNVRKLFFRLEAGSKTNKSTTTGSSGNNTKSVYDFSMSSFSVHPQIIYNIYNSPSVKIPVGIGIGYNFLNYSANILREYYLNPSTDGPIKDKYFSLNGGSVSFVAKAGVVIYNRLEASVLYYPPSVITSFSRYSVAYSNLQVQLSILLGKKVK